MATNDWSRLEDDGSQAIVIDNENQALWVRTGLVFEDNVPAEELGVWIEYQHEYMASSLQGPVLLTLDTWNKLDEIVRSAFKKEK
jgi:hypothetical protein